VKTKMTIDDILPDLQDKSFCKTADKIKKITATDQVILEEEWTDCLLDLVNYGNKHLLKSFQYRLDMEEV
jgi:hypothetical protein